MDCDSPMSSLESVAKVISRLALPADGVEDFPATRVGARKPRVGPLAASGPSMVSASINADSVACEPFKTAPCGGALNAAISAAVLRKARRLLFPPLADAGSSRIQGGSRLHPVAAPALIAVPAPASAP